MLQKSNTHDKKRRQNVEYPVWENTKAQSFVANINLLKLQDIMDKFSTESEHGTRSQEAIDMVTNQILNLFAESASQSFVSKPKLHKFGNARNKPWFGPEYFKIRPILTTFGRLTSQRARAPTRQLSNCRPI